MSDLLTMANHLLAAWVAGQSAGGVWQTREFRVDSTGATLIGQLTHASWRGDVIVRANVEPAQGLRQTIRLTVEQWPQHMPAALEPLRAALKTARLTLELDFPTGEPV